MGLHAGRHASQKSGLPTRTGGACLRVHSATASSFEVISYLHESDIDIFSRPVDSLFLLSRSFVFGIPISVKAITRG